MPSSCSALTTGFLSILKGEWMLLLVDEACRNMLFRLRLGVMGVASLLLVCRYGCIKRYVGLFSRVFGRLIDRLALLWNKVVCISVPVGVLSGVVDRQVGMVGEDIVAVPVVGCSSPLNYFFAWPL